jgi:organic hydroperoxide reductase OsmC/OhrA
MPTADQSPPLGLTLERRSGYEFLVRLDEPMVPEFIVEEGPPIGEGRGPSPDALLGTAIGSCLASSLLFCLTKAHVVVDKFSARVELERVRNERGRLRIGSVKVALMVEMPDDQRERFERCRQIFEDYCTVTESVRHGISVEVDVSSP